jgi:hypothetical protein
MKKKNQLIITTFLCAVLSCLSIFLVPGLAISEGEKEQENIQVTTKQDLKDNVQQKSEETQVRESAELVQDALNAYDETINAVDALNEGDKDKALEALERAVGKLNIVLGRRPQLALIPIQSKVETIDINADLPTIEIKRAEVEFLMKQGHLQAARKLLDTLVSEIRVTTANLPMETYPVAIRGIARLLEEDKIEEAKRALQQILSTVVIIERSVPIPIINSQLLIAEAQKVTEETNPEELSSDKKDDALDMLKQAKVELEIAEALGYGRKNREFKEIRDDIVEIEKKIGKSEKTGNLFDDLKERLNIFKNKVSD